MPVPKQDLPQQGLSRYQIGGTAIAFDEAQVDLPANRTLYAGCFTIEAADIPMVISGLKTLGEVFRYYKPALAIHVTTANESNADEYFAFQSIADFSPASIIKNSIVLDALDNEIETLQRFINATTVDDRLIACFLNVESRGDIIKPFSLFLEELTDQESGIADKDRRQQGLIEALANVESYGRMEFLTRLIPQLTNMDPSKKARRSIFLEDSTYNSARDLLQKKLSTWISLLQESSLTAAIDAATLQLKTLTSILYNNVIKILDAIREIEVSYRTLQSFLQNTEEEKIKNVSFLNASITQLQNNENDGLLETVKIELQSNFHTYDLRTNYSILVLPGYLQSRDILRKWGEVAHANKVVLITDMDDLYDPDEVAEVFDNNMFSGADAWHGSVAMTCNWLQGRERYTQFGESTDLYLPPSAAYAGKLYTQLLVQATAGKKYAGLNSIEAVRFQLRKSEISTFENMGITAMVQEYGKVMAFANRTIYTGDNLALKSISIVRTFDYITKVMVAVLHGRAFENLTKLSIREFQQEIVRFLDRVVGPGKLIEKYKITRFESSPENVLHLKLYIDLLPYFPARFFSIRLDFSLSKDGSAVEWAAQYV